MTTTEMFNKFDKKMKSINVRYLSHETGKVLDRVALSESVEIRRRNKPIAVIQPAKNETGQIRPNFRARLESIYGQTVLDKTATELLREERGEQ